MKTLLFGGRGQLGFELEKRIRALHLEVVCTDIPETDITQPAQVSSIVEQVKPHVIINCAAYTQVDLAEEDREKAFLINKDGAAHVAQAAKERGCRLIHLSTDYVFDGSRRTPVTEKMKVNPINVYGESKLAGDKEVERILEGHGVIVRTSSLHGQNGANFVHTMLDLFQKKDELRVVSDQVMSPTWAGWLAETLIDLSKIDCSGIFHASSKGAVSWYDFARAILGLVAERLPGAANTQIKPCSAEEFKRPAARPAYSVLDCSKLAKVLGREPLRWQTGLKEHLCDLGHIEK